MATSLQSSFPECPICCEDFKTPKLIWCGHTFCLSCLKQYIGDKTSDFSCPVCGQNVKIPDGGPENFPTNFIAQTSTSQREGKNPTRQESSSQTKVNYSINKLQLDDTKPTHYCPNHKQRMIDYYCKNCNLGLCAKCVFTHHKDHENIDLECPQTKSTALQDISNCEQFIQNKIQELEKQHASLQELCEKLNSLCEESCNKITKQTDKIIADLKAKCEKTKTEIRENLKQNNKTLTNIMADNTKQVDDLKSNLKGELCSMTEDSTLNLIQTLSKIQDLKEQCDNIKVVVPEVRYLEWKESDFKLGENILGSLQPQLLYKPDLLVKSSSQCFIFNCNDIQGDYVWYYSKDKVNDNNVVWSCGVWRWSDRNVYISITPLVEDNPHLVSIHITSTLTLLNTDIHKSIIEERDYKFTPDSWDGARLIPWNRLVDKTQGFVNNEGQFKVKFEINQVKDFKFK